MSVLTLVISEVIQNIVLYYNVVFPLKIYVMHCFCLSYNICVFVFGLCF